MGKKRFFRNLWFKIRHPFTTAYIRKVKHVSSFYPISILDVDMAYHRMNHNYPVFKAMGEKYKWEFLEGCFYLARETARDHMVVVNEQWKEKLG